VSVLNASARRQIVATRESIGSQDWSSKQRFEAEGVCRLAAAALAASDSRGLLLMLIQWLSPSLLLMLTD
jgi:hypothetical protein